MITRKLANTNNMILRAIENFLEVLKVQSYTSNTPFFWVLWADQVIINFEKWPIGHFWCRKIWSTHRQTFPLVSGNRYDHRGPRKHKQCMIESHRKFSWAHWSRIIILLKLSFWGPHSKPFGILTVTFEKSPVAYVWVDRIRSMRRMNTQFISVDRYDHKEFRKYK